MAAASTGLPAVVELLIEKGAKVNARDKEGRTARTHARETGHKEIIELLKARGAKQ